MLMGRDYSEVEKEVRWLYADDSMQEKSNTYKAAIKAAKYWRKQIDTETDDVHYFIDGSWGSASQEVIEGLIDEHLLCAVPKKYQKSYLFWFFFLMILSNYQYLTDAETHEWQPLRALSLRMDFLQNWRDGFFVATGIRWPLDKESLLPLVVKEATKESNGIQRKEAR
jgi:hypothetical protein